MPEESVKPLPFFYVGREETHKRVNLFLNSKHKVQSDSIGKPDTKAVWYSFEHIEGLLNEMRDANADGLRIYFGTYGEEHGDLKNQTSLLMVMTRLNTETGAHADFDIEDEPNFPDRSALERDFNVSDEKNFNVGSPCPPICSNQEMKYGV